MIAANTYGAGNREGMPADWLSETKEIRRKSDAPGWDLYFDSQADVDAYLGARRASYEASRPTKQPFIDPLRAELDDIKARLTALEGR